MDGWYIYSRGSEQSIFLFICFPVCFLFLFCWFRCISPSSQLPASEVLVATSIGCTQCPPKVNNEGADERESATGVPSWVKECFLPLIVLSLSLQHYLSNQTTAAWPGSRPRLVRHLEIHNTNCEALGRNTFRLRQSRYSKSSSCFHRQRGHPGREQLPGTSKAARTNSFGRDGLRQAIVDPLPAASHNQAASRQLVYEAPLVVLRIATPSGS